MINIKTKYSFPYNNNNAFGQSATNTNNNMMMLAQQTTAMFQNQSTQNFLSSTDSNATGGVGKQATAIFPHNEIQEEESDDDRNDDPCHRRGNDESFTAKISLSGTLPKLESESFTTKTTDNNKNDSNNDNFNYTSSSSLRGGGEKESFYHQALSIVQSKRGECYPNIGFVQALMDYEKALKSLTPPVLTPRMSPQRTLSPRKSVVVNGGPTTTNSSDNWNSPDSNSSFANLHQQHHRQHTATNSSFAPQHSSASSSAMTRASTSAPQ